jgi:hypothetical protein
VLLALLVLLANLYFFANSINSSTVRLLLALLLALLLLLAVLVLRLTTSFLS